MRNLLICMLFTVSFVSCSKQDPLVIEEEMSAMYFPPLDSEEWKTTNPADLGWNSDALEETFEFLKESDSRAFLILKDGKIVVEKYWNKGLLNQDFDSNSNWYWASAAKSLTSFIVGQAVSQGHIDINEPSSTYLGNEWSTLEKELEDKITVKHHLSMTTGLDDSKNADCTDQDCFKYLAGPGTRWAYHNAAYTILDKVVESATGETFDDFFASNLKEKIGMDGFWTYQNYNHLYFSTPRSMARFGHLVLNQGRWDGNLLIEDQDYLQQSIESSQAINPSYGYLWWLNGKSSIMYPGLQFSFNISMSENAPPDMYAAIGKNSQLINIVPSEGLVVIRMGSDPDNSLVPTTFQENLWEFLNKVLDR